MANANDRMAGCIKFYAQIAYAHGLWKKQRIGNDPNSKPKYSVSFIFDKNGEAHQLVRSTLQEVAERKWPGKGQQMLRMLSAAKNICLRDGNAKANQQGFEGRVFISASADNQPGVFHRIKDPATGKAKILRLEDGIITSGCWVLADVQIWAMDNQWGKKLNATLRGAQYYGEGEHWAAGAPPADADEYEALDDTGEDMADTGYGDTGEDMADNGLI